MLAAIAAQGYPGFDVPTWFGVVGPARLPKEVVGLGACRTWKSPAANRPQRPIFYRLFAQ
ncbi:MAG: hypothetical protein JSS31_17405 [Proteobacteria bacterium]|nr:hypothetical protein [Pseudomonadota bacterium]